MSINPIDSHKSGSKVINAYKEPLQLKILSQSTHKLDKDHYPIGLQTYGIVHANDPYIATETIGLMACFSFAFISNSGKCLKNNGNKYILMTHFGIPKENEFTSSKIIESEIPKSINTNQLTEDNHAFIIFHKNIAEMPAMEKIVKKIIEQSQNRIIQNISRKANIIKVPYSKTMPMNTGFAMVKIDGTYKTDLESGKWN
ncbi:MAG: hypothetical protein ACKO3R_02200 [bacterium]